MVDGNEVPRTVKVRHRARRGSLGITVPISFANPAMGMKFGAPRSSTMSQSSGGRSPRALDANERVGSRLWPGSGDRSAHNNSGAGALPRTVTSRQVGEHEGIRLPACLLVLGVLVAYLLASCLLGNVWSTAVRVACVARAPVGAGHRRPRCHRIHVRRCGDILLKTESERQVRFDDEGHWS
jgi:hypothetical protein